LPPADQYNLTKVVEQRGLQDVLQYPLTGYPIATTVIPQQILEVKVIYRNENNIPLRVAFLQEDEGLWDKIKKFITRQNPNEKIYKVQPILSMVVVVDPADLDTRFNIKTVKPSPLKETEPGFGCYDVVVVNPTQMAVIAKQLEEGQIDYDKIMCGNIEGDSTFKYAKSIAGPATYVLPVQYQVNTTYGRVIAKVDEQGNVLSYIVGCSDKGDGRPITYTINGQEITIESKPHDCILTPGESIEYTYYIIVNALPSNLIPAEASGDVVAAIMSGDQLKIAQLMEQYPGAIHDVRMYLGQLKNIETGATFTDYLKEFVNVIISPFRVAAVYISGDYMNWYKLALDNKLLRCMYNRECIYKIYSYRMDDLFVVIVPPQFSGSIQIANYGLILLSAVIGSLAGRYIAKRT